MAIVAYTKARIDALLAALNGQYTTASAGQALATRIAALENNAPAPTKSPIVAAPTTASSSVARWWIPYGNVPHCRVTYTTGVNASGQMQVTWAGSMPDVRARTSKLETGVAAQAQDGWQAYVVDLSTNTTVADSGVQSGIAEVWVVTGLTPVAGRRYQGFARVRSVDGQWSPYGSTRFVVPTGTVRYFEDYGAIGDGVHVDGADYPNKIYTGPIRQAMAACRPGDVLKSKNPGVTVAGVSVTGTTVTAANASFSSSMVGKKIMVHRAGVRDATGDSYIWRTTVSAVSSDGTSLTLAAAVKTAQTSTRVVIGYPEYLTGHMDVDSNVNAGSGGFTVDGTGCLFTSTSPDSAGFHTAIPDVTYINVHYWHRNVTVRGNGKNGDSGTFFTDGTNAVGGRWIGCYSERARDAAWLFFSGPSDMHVVDCITDHSNADPFHVTGSSHDIQFIRPTAIYIGDDATANIGYRSDGDSKRPYNIYWENPKMFGQDWGRGLSFGGCYNVLATDVTQDGGAMASFLIGSDGDQANTNHVQVRRFTITNPHSRVGLKPTYTQGASTTSTIANDPWLKLLNNGSTTPQADILMEDGTVDGGNFIQVVSYGGGAFNDASVVLRGITMTGATSSGTNWVDQSTYAGHLDFRGITVPTGSSPQAAPSNPNS